MQKRKRASATQKQARRLVQRARSNRRTNNNNKKLSRRALKNCFFALADHRHDSSSSPLPQATFSADAQLQKIRARSRAAGRQCKTLLARVSGVLSHTFALSNNNKKSNEKLQVQNATFNARCQQTARAQSNKCRRLFFALFLIRQNPFFCLFASRAVDRRHQIGRSRSSNDHRLRARLVCVWVIVFSLAKRAHANVLLNSHEQVSREKNEKSAVFVDCKTKK